MLDHVNHVSRAYFYQIRWLRCVRSFPSQDAAKMLVHAFILAGSFTATLCFWVRRHVHIICKTQAVINAADRFICSVGRFDNFTPKMMDKLRWLPVRQCIEYQIALLKVSIYTVLGHCILVTAALHLITEAHLRHRLQSFTYI